MITVMEGNYNEAVARRQIPVGWGQIRGYARPKYAEGVTGQPSKSIEEVAGEVIQGKYGNGEERRKKLCDMGYDPDAVQREVNSEEVAGEVIQGKYGNGEERRKKLCDMGYDPDAVQREVNRQLSQNEAQAEYYVVQENDTLSEIAILYQRLQSVLQQLIWNWQHGMELQIRT